MRRTSTLITLISFLIALVGPSIATGAGTTSLKIYNSGTINYSTNTHAPPTSLQVVRTLIDDNNIIASDYQPVLYNENKMFVVYLAGVQGDVWPKIRAYNYLTKQWGHSYKIGQIFDVGGQIDADRHNAPSIGVLPNGKLIVFYGNHGGEGGIYSISTYANNEASWSQQYTTWSSWTYPHIMTFSDKAVVIGRLKVDASNWGDNTPDAQRWCWNLIETSDGLAWKYDTYDSMRTIIRGPVGIGTPYIYNPYFTFRKIGNYIFGTGVQFPHINECPESIGRNLYFIYSDDKGQTWKKADGTRLSLPVDIYADGSSPIKIADIIPELAYFPTSCLDENGKPVVLTHGRGGFSPSYACMIAQFSGKLGQPGTWTCDYMKDTKGNIITNRCHKSNIVLDPVFKVPVVWSVNAEDQYLKRWVRVSGETHKFKLAFSETSTHISDFGGFFFAVDSGRPLYPYDGVISEMIRGEIAVYAYGLKEK